MTHGSRECPCKMSIGDFIARGVHCVHGNGALFPSPDPNGVPAFAGCYCTLSTVIAPLGNRPMTNDTIHTENIMELKYGNITIDSADLPESTVNALMSRGFAHILGNEVASKVTAWKKSEDGVNADADEVKAYTEAARNTMLQKLKDGTLGVRVGGPRGTALDTIIRQVAIERLKANFAAAKVKFPANNKDTVNIGGKQMNRTAIIEAHIEKYRDVIEAEAERRAAEAKGETSEDLSELV